MVDICVYVRGHIVILRESGVNVRQSQATRSNQIWEQQSPRCSSDISVLLSKSHTHPEPTVVAQLRHPAREEVRKQFVLTK